MKFKKYTVKVYENGTKKWYKKGKLHRLDGPAIECEDGTKYWCKQGNLHREDGPAVERAYGDKHWYLKGKEYTEKAFDKKVSSKLKE